MQPELDLVTLALVALGLLIAGVIFVRDRKRGRAEWDPRPPNVRERIVCSFWLVAFAIAGASYYAGWQFFGHYDKWVFGGLLLGGLFLINRLPSMKRT